MKWLLGILIICSTIHDYAQNCDVRTITTLKKSLSETSGLLFIENKFVTFNDSGGDPELYEIDTTDGSIKRTVDIKNASNEDWEAITQDDKHIYIGDIGNNKGNRKDLTIYKINIKDFLKKNSVKAEVINIKYKNQTSFKSSAHENLFDAEAMVVMNDSLVIFNKNWLNDTCLIYKLPTKPGDYEIMSKESIVLPGRVTDAVYNPNFNQLFIVGYGAEPFLASVVTQNFKFSKSEIFICNLRTENSIQIEGVCTDNNTVYISSERIEMGSIEFKGEIAEVPFAFTLGRVKGNSSQLSVFVRGETFIFESGKKKIKNIQLFDQANKSVSDEKVSTKIYELDVSKLNKGIYTVQVRLSNKKLERVKITVI